MFTTTISALALIGAAQAHMSLYYPPPLGGAPSINKFSKTTDPEFNYPLGCCGNDGGPTEKSPGICRGYLDRFDTEEAQVTWQAGGDAHFQLTDYTYDPGAEGSTHYGGSCQVGFSVDKGKTWKVAASYHGACPKHTDDGKPEAQTFDFKVPTGMPEGDALFSWIWLNREHEAFENCAKVKITAGSGSSPVQSPAPAQSSAMPQYPVQSSAAPPPPAPSSTKPKPAPIPSAQPKQPTNDNDAEDENDDDSGPDDSWWNRPHPDVKDGDRKYNVDNWTCTCGHGDNHSRCYCVGDEAAPEKRAAAEKKALRMHRRTLYKRVDSCDWASAPPMETSYYTVDAKCAPNAKMNVPESDTFELGWDVKCGVVQGDGEYPIKMMECEMYGGGGY
jgi:hypothetical protein